MECIIKDNKYGVLEELLSLEGDSLDDGSQTRYSLLCVTHLEQFYNDMLDGVSSIVTKAGILECQIYDIESYNEKVNSNILKRYKEQCSKKLKEYNKIIEDKIKYITTEK